MTNVTDLISVMIFAPTFSRVASQPSISPVAKQSAAESDKQSKQSRDSAPDWSTLQAIPIPEDHVRKVNDYLLAQHRKDSEKSVEKGKKDSVKQRYSYQSPSLGSFLNVMA